MSSAPSLSPELRERLRRMAHVALDMDGTIYLGDKLFPETLPFLAQLESLGIGHSFLTNNPSKSVSDYLRHLKKMGILASRDDIYTSTHATIDHLRRAHPGLTKLFILGTPGMTGEFTTAGFRSTADDANDEPQAVVVGFDSTLSYERLCRAAWWIRQGKPYVATNPDFVCPTNQPTVLVDCGSICAALEKAAGRAPDIVPGKPDPAMIGGLMKRHSLGADQVAMVGDRIYTDMAMARRANVLGVLVLTGEATAADARAASPAPDLVVPSIAEFGEMLQEVHSTRG